jgi:hypothetical protein
LKKKNLFKISSGYKKYRITTVLKVETDIIASIAASPTGRAVVLMIIYVEIFKTDIIVFICDVTQTDNFQFLRNASYELM